MIVSLASVCAGAARGGGGRPQLLPLVLVHSGAAPQSRRMDSAATAARILRDGDGLATRRSLLAAGVSPGWLRRRLLRDIWSEPLPGVVDSADVCRTQHGWVRACLEFAGPGSCLSHQTAAVVHGLLPGEGFGQPIHVTVPHGRHKQATAGLVLHQTGQECEVDLVDDIPVTSPAVTIVDLASVMGINDLRCVAADAVRHRLVAVHELHRSKRPARRVRGCSHGSSRNSRRERSPVPKLLTGVASGMLACRCRC